MEIKNNIFRRPVERIDRVGMKYIQKYIYPYFTRRLSSEDVVFLNLGYEEDPPMTLSLEGRDVANRYYIQLYHCTATQVDLGGKSVLEVGCGHGGGASYLARTLQPASYTGMDLNPSGIAFCRKRHDLPGLEFVQGDAEDLPFPDQSFDSVINIESSVHYPQFPVFLTEVARVLRSGGYFLYADYRPAGGIAAWEQALASAPLRMLSERNINAEVVRALELNAQQRLDQINRCTPALLRPVARAQDAWGLAALRDGKLSYRMYSFIKD